MLQESLQTLESPRLLELSGLTRSMRLIGVAWQSQLWAVTGEAVGCGVDEDSWRARKARSRCVCLWNFARRACAGLWPSFRCVLGVGAANLAVEDALSV